MPASAAGERAFFVALAVGPLTASLRQYETSPTSPVDLVLCCCLFVPDFAGTQWVSREDRFLNEKGQGASLLPLLEKP